MWCRQGQRQSGWMFHVVNPHFPNSFPIITQGRDRGAISKKRKAAEAPPAASPVVIYLFWKVRHWVPLLEETSPQQASTQTLWALQRLWLLYVQPFTLHWMSVSTAGLLQAAFWALPGRRSSKRSAAGLAGFLGGRAVHLDPGKAAVVVLIVLAICHLTFQTVHTRHLVLR